MSNAEYDHHAHDRKRRARTPQESIDFINSDYPCCLPIGDVCQITGALEAVERDLAQARDTNRKLNRDNQSLQHSLSLESTKRAWHRYFTCAMKLFSEEADKREAVERERDSYKEALTLAMNYRHIEHPSLDTKWQGSINQAIEWAEENINETHAPGALAKRILTETKELRELAALKAGKDGQK